MLPSGYYIEFKIPNRRENAVGPNPKCSKKILNKTYKDVKDVDIFLPLPSLHHYIPIGAN